MEIKNIYYKGGFHVITTVSQTIQIFDGKYNFQLLQNLFTYSRA